MIRNQINSSSKMCSRERKHIVNEVEGDEFQQEVTENLG